MAEFKYDQFVVVAEKEWKLEYGSSSPGTWSWIKFPVTIGDIDWQMNSSLSIGNGVYISLTCTSLDDERSVDQVHLEIHGYHRVDNYRPGVGQLVGPGQLGIGQPTGVHTTNYGSGPGQAGIGEPGNQPAIWQPGFGPSIRPGMAPMMHLGMGPMTHQGIQAGIGAGVQAPNYVTIPLRHIFKKEDDCLHFTAPLSGMNVCILFNIRILKERALLPNYKSETVKFGSLESNAKLRIAGQIFHANRELLSNHSKVFNEMFNGESEKANKTEIELIHEPADPALFEDFLLVLFQNALPNRNNLAGLFKLADYYKADIVREKCERHFHMCREMPVEERYMLALEIGNKQMQDSIMNVADSADLKRIVAVLAKERSEGLDANKRRRID